MSNSNKPSCSTCLHDMPDSQHFAVCDGATVCNIAHMRRVAKWLEGSQSNPCPGYEKRGGTPKVKVGPSRTDIQNAPRGVFLLFYTKSNPDEPVCGQKGADGAWRGANKQQFGSLNGQYPDCSIASFAVIECGR